MISFGNITIKSKTKTENVADFHLKTEKKLVTAISFYYMICFLGSFLSVKQKHDMVAAISVDNFPRVLQTKQKQFR